MLPGMDKCGLKIPIRIKGPQQRSHLHEIRAGTNNTAQVDHGEIPCRRFLRNR
jgi:hypothetical protein